MSINICIYIYIHIFVCVCVMQLCMKLCVRMMIIGHVPGALKIKLCLQVVFASQPQFRFFFRFKSKVLSFQIEVGESTINCDVMVGVTMSHGWL